MGQDALSSEEASNSSSNSDEELAAQSNMSVRKDCIQCLAHAQLNFVDFSCSGQDQDPSDETIVGQRQTGRAVSK